MTGLGADRNQIVVGIAEAAVANAPDSKLVTYALGSCIAVAAHDPSVKIGGLLHFLLPHSSLDTRRGQTNPFLYADTGIPALIRLLEERGAKKNRLRLYAAGAAHFMDDGGIFNVGKRNRESLANVLYLLGLKTHSEWLGGRESRSVCLHNTTGQIFLRAGTGRWLAHGVQTSAMSA